MAVEKSFLLLHLYHRDDSDHIGTVRHGGQTGRTTHSTQQKQQKTENGSRLLIDARNKALSGHVRTREPLISIFNGKISVITLWPNLVFAALGTLLSGLSQ
jgi:hypothetical protein